MDGIEPEVKRTGGGWLGVAESVRILANSRLLVGFPAESAGRDEGPLTNAALAYIHDNGAPEAGIPPGEAVSQHGGD